MSKEAFREHVLKYSVEYGYDCEVSFVGDMVQVKYNSGFILFKQRPTHQWSLESTYGASHVLLVHARKILEM